MKTPAPKIAFFSLIVAGLVVAPLFLRAQDTSTNAPDTTTTPLPPVKHHRGAPFHGTLDSMDTNAMTLTVGSRTFAVTSKTKIMKDGAPAILADGVIGQPVSGYYHTNEDEGTLEATSVHFGAHKKKKQNTDDSGAMSTNSPSSN
jgi:hypothetical protein